jgi:hypothetical protein
MAASKIAVGFLFMAVLVAAPARAESILFNTLGPGDRFDGAALFFGFDEGEEGDPDRRFTWAMPFSPSSTAALRSIELALDFNPDFSPATLVINLFAADGLLPGQLLETFTRTGPLGRGVHSFGSAGEPVLRAGQGYFIEATTTGRGFGAWYFSSEEPDEFARGADVFRNNNGPWQRLTVQGNILALRVSGDPAPIPEPASMILVGTVLALVPLRRRLSSPKRSSVPFSLTFRRASPRQRRAPEAVDAV